MLNLFLANYPEEEFPDPSIFKTNTVHIYLNCKKCFCCCCFGCIVTFYTSLSYLPYIAYKVQLKMLLTSKNIKDKKCSDIRFFPL